MFRIGKVVERSAVARRRLACRFLLRQMTHRRMRRCQIPKHEEIESGLLDVDAETHRIERARLTDDIRRIVQFLSRLEVSKAGSQRRRSSCAAIGAICAAGLFYIRIFRPTIAPVQPAHKDSSFLAAAVIVKVRQLTAVNRPDVDST
ncbi:MAG: hypothetical protein M5R42_01950 [Rhodocyclaceae bacterium]|nr:hypothetical protein [Rhodocyclaceae bacterium]